MIPELTYCEWKKFLENANHLTRTKYILFREDAKTRIEFLGCDPIFYYMYCGNWESLQIKEKTFATNSARFTLHWYEKYQDPFKKKLQ